MKWPFIIATILLSTFAPTQQVSYQQKQKYFQKLLQVQKNMNNHVQQLRLTVQNTIQQVQSLKSHPDLQRATLQSGVKIERQKLESTFRQTVIPLKDNYWSCKNLSYSEKDLIAKKIKDMKDKTDSINRKIQGQNDCTRNLQLKSHVKFLELHIQSLQNQLSNTCQPPRKDDKLVNNIKDTDHKWIYGDKLTPKQYDDKIKDLQSKNNLVNCPKDKPFLINNQCATCENNEQIFSLSEQKCVKSCPQNTVFLKSSHECVDPTKKQLVSPDLNNLDKQKYPFVWGPITQPQYNDRIKQLKDNNIPFQQCPADNPFTGSNGERCVSCPNGQVFNVGTKQCQHCQNGKKYVQKIHQCKPVFKKPNYQKGTNWIAPNGNNKPINDKLSDLQYQNNPVEQCPADKPFPTKDFKQCVSCDKHYDLIRGTCDNCQKYFEIKEGGHQCVYVQKNCQTDKYWNGQQCIKCLKPGSYDNNQRKCQCPVNQKYNEQTGQCLAAGQHLKNPSPNKANNFVGTAPAPSKFLSNCPDDKPFYQSQTKECISCPLPSKYYNYNKNKCQQCDKNLQFNIQTKQCSKPVDIFNSVVGPNSNNYCCGQPTQDKSKNNCPDNQPFFDGYHCISCQKPQYFDFKENKCKRCPNDQAFSTFKKQCINAAWVSPKIVSNIPNGKNNYYGPIPIVKQDIQGQQINKCPTQKPFSNGKQCFSCDQPRYFNFQSNQCELCKQGFSFSNDKRECQRNAVVGGDFFNSNMVNAQNFVGTVPEYKKQHPQCKQWQRYFNGAKCQKCQLPGYWNFDKKQCLQCKKGLYFEKKARKCIYEQGSQSFKTNLDDTKNIYYNGNFQDVKRQINNSHKQSCPKEKPFFDKSSNECISCWGDNYIFNYVKNHCMKCPGNTHFNEERHICFQNGVKPTIQRMVMNSVSWI